MTAIPPTTAAIVGIPGPVLGTADAALLRDHRPAGVILFGRNVESPAQLRALTESLRHVLPADAVLLVDQEGGRVARLRPPHWRAHLAAGVIGARFATDPAAATRAAWLTGALIGIDCADAGFDVVCAPVLDRRLDGRHDVVGDRGYAADPETVAILGRAMADGLLAAGIQPVMKHLPGHGRALADTHLSMPVINDAEPGDLIAFIRNAALPWAMTAHILYPEWDRQHPATLSPQIITAVIRGVIGFDGVLVSDDLAMQALSGGAADRALQALAAGCDLAMYCSGDPTDTEAVLQACPPLAPAAVARMARARAMARDARTTLDADALAAEREHHLS